MNFRQQNLIAQILGISFYFVVCFLLFVSVGEAQTNKNNVRRQTTEKMLAEAASAIASEDLTRAADILQKILVLEPRNWSAHTLAGVTAERQNNPAAAETHFAAAAKFNPAAAETHNNYGAILFRQNKKAEAAREFAASLKINPNQTSALINLAQIRFAENDYTAARELFIKAKTIAPDAEILRALVLISLERGEKERAVQEFKDYFASPVPTKDTTLGEMLLSKNLTTEAQKELEFILAGDADNIEALVLLSKVYLAQKICRQPENCLNRRLLAAQRLAAQRKEKFILLWRRFIKPPAIWKTRFRRCVWQSKKNRITNLIGYATACC